MSKFIIILFVTISLCSAGHLLTNGNFEQQLYIGWIQTIGTQSVYDTIDRQTYYDPDPDYEVRVKKYDATHAILYQTVDVPTTDLQFSAYAKLFAYEYSDSGPYWAAAAVVLRYLDNNNNLLGETRIVHKSPHCPWANTNTVHIITVTDPNNWYTYNFNINNELANLSGVNPPNIRKIQVALLDTTDGC